MPESVASEAAELDPVRGRRWTRVRAVMAAHWSREHGDPARLTQATDHLAELLV
jgi:hypothetical protein